MNSIKRKNITKGKEGHYAICPECEAVLNVYESKYLYSFYCKHCKNTIKVED